MTLLACPPAPWTQHDWMRLEQDTARRAVASGSDEAAWRIVHRHARRVLCAYSTSFFMVTRFLPPAKRAQVEVVYAAVRYPDEIVDTFPLHPGARLARLAEWTAQYERAREIGSVRAAIADGLPTVLAAWASVVRAADIPPVYYRDFLAAMRRDAHPRPFATLDDLVDGYVYGSAVVVGYFLAHVYGPARGRTLAAALAAARDLAIALQLTNFLRDVREDARRGRVYLPQDLLEREGIVRMNVDDPAQYAALTRVLRGMAAHAERLYARAHAELGAYSDDSQVAIRACIDVYRQLNARIGRSPDALLHRAQVPFLDKCRVLPTSKYWRLPLAYLAG